MNSPGTAIRATGRSTWTAEACWTGAPEFRNLIDLPSLLPYLDDLLPKGYRFDHAYGIFSRDETETVGMRLHYGGTPFDPAKCYQVREGAIYRGLLAVSFALTRCAPEDGGFRVIPGSHKSNFRLPPDLPEEGPDSPVRQVPLDHGDEVVFTEAVTHGSQPWRGDGQRRVLIYKYCPGYMQWECSSPGVTVDDRFTSAQRALMRAPFRSGGRQQRGAAPLRRPALYPGLRR